MQIDGCIDRDFGEARGRRADFGEVSPTGKIAKERRQQDALPQAAQRHGKSNVIGGFSRRGDVFLQPGHSVIERGERTRCELGPRSSKACAVQAELERLGRVHRER